MSGMAAALLLSGALLTAQGGAVGSAGSTQPAAAAASEGSAGAVEGVVWSSDGGQPLAYARVLVVGDSLADWTDDRGAYRLTDLARGEWQLRVIHPGHDSLDVAIFVPGDRSVRVDVTLQARPGPTVDALADFQPFQVEFTLPTLLNGADLSSLMQRLYPPDLAHRRIGGEAVLRLWLDEGGRVVKSLISASSGQPALDSIALTVSERMRFLPARSRWEGVRVIVRMPVTFTVPDSVPDAAPQRR